MVEKLRVPETVTHHVQEGHISIYHTICLTMEEELI